MFTIALASFANHRYCYLKFQSLSAFYRILSAKHLTSLTNPFCFFFLSLGGKGIGFFSKFHNTLFLCSQASSVKLIGFLALQHAFSLFQKGAENLLAINRKTEFPHFSLTLPISKIFPGFLKIPRPFPDRGNIVFESKSNLTNCQARFVFTKIAATQERGIAFAQLVWMKNKLLMKYKIVYLSWFSILPHLHNKNI